MSHERDKRRLRDRLLFADRQRFVSISERVLRGRDEEMAGQLTNCPDDAGVGPLSDRISIVTN
jgi:hypothetical protein